MKSLWSKILCAVLVASMVVGAIWFVPNNTSDQPSEIISDEKQLEADVSGGVTADKNTKSDSDSKGGSVNIGSKEASADTNETKEEGISKVEEEESSEPK